MYLVSSPLLCRKLIQIESHNGSSKLVVSTKAQLLTFRISGVAVAVCLKKFEYFLHNLFVHHDTNFITLTVYNHRPTPRMYLPRKGTECGDYLFCMI